MIRARSRWLAFSPLLLLSLLFFAGRVKIGIGASAPNPEVGVLRYFVIPLVGLSLGATVFFLLLRWRKTEELGAQCNGFLEKRAKISVWGLTAVFLLLYLGLSLSSYLTLHLGLFDFGIYDARIWQVYAAPGLAAKLKIACTGHFQPILILYAFCYDFVDSPGILLVLQALATLSGVIPLLLLCRKKINTRVIIFGITVLYFLYPPLVFNSVLDFHLDHLYVPVMLWAFYYAEEQRFGAMAPFLLLACMIKEPYILGVAFFGIYIVWKHKKYILGLLILTSSVVLFYGVTFYLLPLTTHPLSGRTMLQGPAFAYLGSSPLSILTNLAFHPFFILKELFRPSKLRFPFFVLYPFLFLPLLKPKEFLPAVPCLLIPLLSTNPHHQNVASQYTAGIIPPLFVALIFIFTGAKARFGQQATLALLAGMLVLTLTLDVAHSPLPLSVDFWNKSWSFGRYHYSNYLMGEHERYLKQGINLIPEDPDLKVVLHSGIYQRRLFHRFRFDCFPKGIGDADYVILDNTRGYLLCDQRVSENQYFDKVKQLEQMHAFMRIFARDGILVFRR